MTTRTAALADALRERLALGQVGVGGALESEAKLTERYGVSRVTVRRALEQLRAEGLLESKPGAGWFATSLIFRQSLAVGQFRHASSAISQAGKLLERSVVKFGFDAAPDDVAGRLNIEVGSEVLSTVSVRTVEGAPLDVVHEWVPADLAFDITRASAQQRGLWSVLRSQGHRIDAVHQSISAALLSAEDAERLATASGVPTLVVQRLGRDDDRALALSVHRYLAHRFSLELEFRGWSGGVGEDLPGLYATGN